MSFQWIARAYGLPIRLSAADAQSEFTALFFDVLQATCAKLAMRVDPRAPAALRQAKSRAFYMPNTPGRRAELLRELLNSQPDLYRAVVEVLCHLLNALRESPVKSIEKFMFAKSIFCVC